MNIDTILKWIIRLKWPLLIGGAIFLLGLIGYLTILFGGRFVVDEQDLILPAATVVETKAGERIGEIYDEYRRPVTIKQIPDHVEDAFVAIEDNRFYEHAGVDFKAVTRAVFRDIVSMEKAEGGSTITQQLAKNLFLHNDKTWMRKTKEVMAAIYLERNFSKDKILEYYLNEIYFAHGIYGVGAAAEFYFSKPVDELSVTEGALLAAMSKAPNTYSPLIDEEKAKERRDLVLQQMNQLDMLRTEEMLQLQGKTLGVNQQKEEDKPWNASYLDLAIKEAAETYQLTLPELKRGGYRLVVNINETAQRTAYEHFQQDEYFPGSAAGVEGSFVLIDNRSGEIAAAIGGRDYQIGGLNRVTTARQPGSTMKPLAVYGPAMMMEEYSPYSLLVDEERSYGDYTARNYDGSYSGQVTMYEALQQSKNAPAVWLLNEIGIPNAKEYLEKMDISLSDNGLAIALGGLEQGVSPLKLAQAYGTFPNGGEMNSASAINKIFDRNGELLESKLPKPKQVFSPQTAWNMVRMLEAVVDKGTGKAGSYSGALAGKTGSTQHPTAEGKVKDAWFAGFTPEYSSALWMGYDQADEGHFLTAGSEKPTRLTKAILSDLDKSQKLAAKFEQPENVKDVEEPVDLPEITDLSARYSLGGLSLVRGTLTWTASADDRIKYELYRVKNGNEQKIGEVEGKGSYQINRIGLFEQASYYVVPVDPLTGQRGKPSNRAKLSLDF
ncbi:transglycosylase domain-containing protein [Sediminibacillus halophilus]|uniref:Penicillin-binding protein 2A n=1 Tax=Sediminibacillus halophilus TaxID=482461 RepID=A0A1G9PPR6_9BACI|nr:transglycosylase domain-containing protein [Sediminibacillus halophilus]SDM00045.1 penicillin-binding protein 2A [Sediminibacillus halophilus]